MKPKAQRDKDTKMKDRKSSDAKKPQQPQKVYQASSKALQRRKQNKENAVAEDMEVNDND